MNDVEGMFKYENRSWTAIQDCGQVGRFTLILDGDADFMSLSSNVGRVQDMLVSLEQIVIAARKYAIGSLYGPVVDASGGMRVDSVVVHEWDGFRVWFSILDSDRMVGVRMRDGEWVDVYCDH